MGNDELIRLILAIFFGNPADAQTIAEATDIQTPIERAASTSELPYCEGVLHQGGLIICLSEPGDTIEINGKPFAIGEDGSAQLGLARQSPLTIDVRMRSIGMPAGEFRNVETLNIKQRHDEVTTINGIPCDKIDARSPEQKAHAARSWEKKQAGWASFNDGAGALNGFIQPAEGRISSPYGFTRSYVTQGCDTKTRVHWGYDIAAPTGTPIIAPAAGTVALAEDDLYYEGGTIFLDHGHGLMSIFLHMSALEAKVGDVVEAGEQIGKIGATGRVTGPHLHWAVKWRDVSTKDRSGDYYIDPSLLLQLEKN